MCVQEFYRGEGETRIFSRNIEFRGNEIIKEKEKKKFREEILKSRRRRPCTNLPVSFPHVNHHEHKKSFSSILLRSTFLDNYCCSSSRCVHFGGFFFAVFVFRFIKPFPSIHQNSYKKNRNEENNNKKTSFASRVLCLKFFINRANAQRLGSVTNGLSRVDVDIKTVFFPRFSKNSKVNC